MRPSAIPASRDSRVSAWRKVAADARRMCDLVVACCSCRSKTARRRANGGVLWSVLDATACIINVSAVDGDGACSGNEVG